tara:strand:+ start:343 stop:696 length:354 start_codon:yes stop_codon:yes gene_type:complete
MQMSNDIYTEDLGQFGSRELKEASKLILAIDNGLPDDFYNDDIKIGFNKNSGYVFLTNADLQVAMYDSENDQLYSYYSTPYEGHEGSLEELITEYADMCKEDQEYVDNLKNEVNTNV